MWGVEALPVSSCPSPLAPHLTPKSAHRPACLPAVNMHNLHALSYLEQGVALPALRSCLRSANSIYAYMIRWVRGNEGAPRVVGGWVGAGPIGGSSYDKPAALWLVAGGCKRRRPPLGTLAGQHRRSRTAPGPSRTRLAAPSCCSQVPSCSFPRCLPRLPAHREAQAEAHKHHHHLQRSNRCFWLPAAPSSAPPPAPSARPQGSAGGDARHHLPHVFKLLPAAAAGDAAARDAPAAHQ